MSLRAAHGTAARHSSALRFEALPFNELPEGQADLRLPADSAEARRLRAEIAATEAQLVEAKRADKGRIVKGAGASLLGRLGGLRRALKYELARLEGERTEKMAELAAELLPGMVVNDPDFKAGLPLALEFVLVEGQSLSRDVGGGTLATGPGGILTVAALQLLACKVEFARGNFKLGSSLGNDFRTSVSVAHEYTAKRAAARPRKPGSVAWFVDAEPTSPASARASPPAGDEPTEHADAADGQPAVTNPEEP